MSPSMDSNGDRGLARSGNPFTFGSRNLSVYSASAFCTYELPYIKLFFRATLSICLANFLRSTLRKFSSLNWSVYSVDMDKGDTIAVLTTGDSTFRWSRCLIGSQRVKWSYGLKLVRYSGVPWNLPWNLMWFTFGIDWDRWIGSCSLYWLRYSGEYVSSPLSFRVQAFFLLLLRMAAPPLGRRPFAYGTIFSIPSISTSPVTLAFLGLDDKYENGKTYWSECKTEEKYKLLPGGMRFVHVTMIVVA